MEKERNIIKALLPYHYTCEEREGGVHCYSEIGIKDEREWERFKDNVRGFFGGRLQEFFHQTCTYHLRFTVYLKQIPAPSKPSKYKNAPTVPPNRKYES